MLSGKESSGIFVYPNSVFLLTLRFIISFYLFFSPEIMFFRLFPKHRAAKEWVDLKEEKNEKYSGVSFSVSLEEMFNKDCCARNGLFLRSTTSMLWRENAMTTWLILQTLTPIWQLSFHALKILSIICLPTLVLLLTLKSCRNRNRNRCLR